MEKTEPLIEGRVKFPNDPRIKQRRLVRAAIQDHRFDRLTSQERFVLREHILKELFIPIWDIAESLKIPTKKAGQIEERALAKLQRAHPRLVRRGSK